ncbi:MAG: fructose-6-phosphate aldolase [Synergistales bacterium]|nr:fructose-6-phosphate aldolase [Synergistales bacterium]
MRFFLDTANLDEIRQGVAWGVVTGVTTNPSLVAREGAADFHGRVREIADIVPGPVNAEVTALDTDGMVKEGRELAALHPHVVVKIPMTPAGMGAVHRLAAERIKTNVTLVFSPQQALLAATAGAAYVSPFIGRLDDIGEDGIGLVETLAHLMTVHDLQSEVIAASIRHPKHVLDAAMAGAEIATVPFSVLEKLFHHPLTKAGIERFMEDWEAYGRRNG